MREFVLITLFSFLIISVSVGQQAYKIGFKQDSTVVERDRKNNTIFKIALTSSISNPDSLKEYRLKIEPVDSMTTLPRPAFDIDLNEVEFSRLKANQYIYVSLASDSLEDRKRQIALRLSVLKDDGLPDNINNNEGKIAHTIVVKAIKKAEQAKKDTLKKYNYLAYIGTNFDLVDGIKAKNLFFATNIFSPPLTKGSGFGFSFSIYGNRAMTITDTAGRRSYTSRIVGDGTNATYYRQEGLKTINRVTDNWGASFAPLFRLGNSNSDVYKTKIYYAPQLEFVWRKTILRATYSDVVLTDSTTRPSPLKGTIELTPPNAKDAYNIYDFYLGLAGLLLSHENESISVRFQFSAGYNFKYTSKHNDDMEVNNEFDRKGNFHVFTRAWITEPISGITFGAEVANNLFRNHSPYYNVTLSKAINIRNLSGIFSSLSPR